MGSQEYNQEQLRVKSLDGGTSLVRSFPSRVAVRFPRRLESGREGRRPGPDFQEQSFTTARGECVDGRLEPGDRVLSGERPQVGMGWRRAAQRDAQRLAVAHSAY